MAEIQQGLLDPDDHIAALKKRIGELVEDNTLVRAENRKLTAIYKAAEDLMGTMGAMGEVHYEHKRACDLMEAFYDFDEGTRKETMTENAVRSADGKPTPT